MKRKAEGIIIGGAVIFFGMLLYPYWTKYVTTPLTNWLENDFLPLVMGTVPAWLSVIFALAPFLSFALIIFAGTMFIRNRLHGKEEE